MTAQNETVQNETAPDEAVQNSSASTDAASQPSLEAEQEKQPLTTLSEADEPVVIRALEEGEKLSRAQRNVWEERANDILEKIRPYIQHDGGDVDLLGIDEDGIAYVTFLGACAGCMMAGEDFSTGIRLLLLDEFPELREVVLVGA